jgi:hypothetical protein
LPVREWEVQMSTLVTRPKRHLRFLALVLGLLPWIAINVYWIRIGELRAPFWLVLINLLIAFFAFGAPAIDRRSGREP